MCHRLISLCSGESGEQQGSILHEDLIKGLIEQGRPSPGPGWGVYAGGLGRGSMQASRSFLPLNFDLQAGGAGFLSALSLQGSISLIAVLF